MIFWKNGMFPEERDIWLSHVGMFAGRLCEMADRILQSNHFTIAELVRQWRSGLSGVAKCAQNGKTFEGLHKGIMATLIPSCFTPLWTGFTSTDSWMVHSIPSIQPAYGPNVNRSNPVTRVDYHFRSCTFNSSRCLQRLDLITRLSW